MDHQGGDGDPCQLDSPADLDGALDHLRPRRTIRVELAPIEDPSRFREERWWGRWRRSSSSRRASEASLSEDSMRRLSLRSRERDGEERERRSHSRGGGKDQRTTERRSRSRFTRSPSRSHSGVVRYEKKRRERLEKIEKERKRRENDIGGEEKGMEKRRTREREIQGS